MKASELKALVGLLSPCLGDSQIIPALSYLCFDNMGVYAFNDVVATRQDWKHGLGSFGVNGKSLAALLAGWGDRELELSTAKENDILRLVIKSGRSVTKLPVITTSSFVMETPKLIGAATGTITDKVRLIEVLNEVATSAVNPVYKAVTMAAKEGSTDIMAYSTSGQTLIHAKVGKLAFPAKEDKVWIVPKLAVQQMVAISKLDDEKPLRLQFGKQAILAKVADSMVITKLVTEVAAPDFEKPLQGETRIVLKGWQSNKALEEALTTATTIFNETENSRCHFVIDDDRITIVAHSRMGSEFKDKVKLKLKHMDNTAPFEFYCDPNRLLNAFAFSSLKEDTCILQKEAALFGNPKEFLYAAAFSKPVEKQEVEVADEEE